VACVDAGIEERRVLVIGENARQISQLIRAVLADLEVPLNEDTTAIVDFLARGGEYPFSGTFGIPAWGQSPSVACGRQPNCRIDIGVAAGPMRSNGYQV